MSRPACSTVTDWLLGAILVYPPRKLGCQLARGFQLCALALDARQSL